MSVRYSAEVFGYVEKSLKRRMQRIKEMDRFYSESYLIGEGLKRILPEVETELGIPKPAQSPRSARRRRVAA